MSLVGLMLVRFSQTGLAGWVGWAAYGVASAIATVSPWLVGVVQRKMSKRDDAKTKLNDAADVLPLPLRQPEGVAGPSWVLNPDNRVVPFADHNADRATLDRWYDGSASRIVVVRGPAGVGKTRLISEWALSRKGLCVRRVRLGSESGVVGLAESSDDDIVLVVDLTVPRAGLRSVIDDLARVENSSSRLMLECRTEFPVDYVRALMDERSRTLVDDAHRIDLKPSMRSSDVERWISRASTALASIVVPPGDSTAVAPSVRVPSTFRDVTESALIALRGRVGVDSTASDALFDHERAVWHAGALAISPPLDPSTAQTCIGLLTLVGADGEEGAVAVLQRIPELADASGERLHQVAGWIHGLYPDKGTRGWVGTIDPSSIQYSLCGEYIDRKQLRRALVASATSASEVTRVMSILVPASALYPDLNDVLVELVTSAIDSNIPESVLAAVLACDREAADRAMTYVVGAGGLDAAVVELVSNLLGGRLLSTRVALAERAVRDHRPGGDSEALAEALDVLADANSAGGDPGPALEAAVESLEVYRRLYIAAPDPVVQYGVARLSFRIGGMFYEGGLMNEARVYLEESQSAFAVLRAQRGPDYAGGYALAICGVALLDLVAGQVERGLRRLDDAVALARAAPGAQDPRIETDLPRVLAMRAHGRVTYAPRDEDLQAVLEEAIDLNRSRAEHGTVFDVQSYLNTLHCSVIGSMVLGRPMAEDLVFARSVVDIVRGYSSTGPVAFEHHLSEALMNYATIPNLDGDRPCDSVDSIVEALSIEQRLAATGRTRFPMNLARGYLLLGFAYLRSGDLGPATLALDRAITEFERLETRQLGIEAMRKHGGAVMLAARCRALQSRTAESSRLLGDALEHFRASERAYPGIFHAELAISLTACAIVSTDRVRALRYLNEALDLFGTVEATFGDLAEHYRLAVSQRELLLDLELKTTPLA